MCVCVFYMLDPLHPPIIGISPFEARLDPDHKRCNLRNGIRTNNGHFWRKRVSFFAILEKDLCVGLLYLTLVYERSAHMPHNTQLLYKKDGNQCGFAVPKSNFPFLFGFITNT